MKKETKIALAVGGVTVGGVVLYLILKPSTPSPSSSATPPPITPPPATPPTPPPTSQPTVTVSPSALRLVETHPTVTTPQPDFLLTPTSAQTAGLKVGQVIQITPPVTNQVWNLFLMPPPAGGLIAIGPSLQDITPGTTAAGAYQTGIYKAIAAGTQVVRVTAGDMQVFSGQPGWVGDRGPGFDITITVS